MTMINEHKGTVTRVQGNKITVELKRGGKFTTQANRKYCVGEKVCFVLNPVENKIVEVMPKAEADEIVALAVEEHGHGAALLTDYCGLDVTDEDDSGFGEEEAIEDFSYLFDEEEEAAFYANNVASEGQEPPRSFDFECGEPGRNVIDPADYFGDADSMEVPDGSEN